MTTDPSTWRFTYIVRHDNTFDYPSTWAFEDYDEARKLRDALNANNPNPSLGGEYHVEEEPNYPDADTVLAELREEGWFDDDGA